MASYDNKIYLLRKKKKLTRQKLAEKSGVSFETIKHIENGTTKIEDVKLGTLQKLAKGLDCDFKKLI